MTRNGTNWHRQGLAITALVGGATVDDAARMARVSRRTVARWRQEPEFRDRLRELGDYSLAEARSLLKATLPRAVGTLATLLTAADDRTKLRAATALLGPLIAEASPVSAMSPAKPEGRVMIVPAEHLEIVAAAFHRNHQSGDPAVIFLPEEDPMPEQESVRDESLQRCWPPAA